MSNDIEEFLRRAAERRQQAARERSAQQQARAQGRPAPQYTDRATERRVTANPPDETDEATVVAELVEPDRSTAGGLAQRGDAQRAASKRLDAPRPSDSRQQTQTLIQQLVQQLRSPEGFRQAILVREILDPPFHRW